MLFGGGLLLALISFTAVTLLVGQPFYEELAARVDEAEGGAPPEPRRSLWQELWISARDSVRVLVRVAAFGIVLFAAGFVPVVGQTVVPVVGFCVSGFFLTLELAGSPSSAGTCSSVTNCGCCAAGCRWCWASGCRWCWPSSSRWSRSC